ncbi:hypothetical protein [Streptomyces sp. NPDC059564]|uniref:hypothetical protein n=1 Tax=Streptomyces sp. NPDC059564 TaxID=3346865 RepID=UPI0036B8B953
MSFVARGRVEIEIDPPPGSSQGVHFSRKGPPPRLQGKRCGMNQDHESGRAGRISKHVGWWIAALAGLAGIAGLIFAIVTRDRFTVEDWVKQDNAVCDGLSPQMTKEVRTAEASLIVRVDGGYKSADYQPAATAWDALGTTERKLSSEMGKIETPESHTKEIARLLDAMNDVSDQDLALSDKLQVQDITSESQTAQDIAKWRRQYVDQVNADLTRLNARHCLPKQ